MIAHPWVGLLMVVPGKDETLRINGPAALTADPEILGGFTQELRPPKLAMVIEVAEVFGHCAKAFRRANAWHPAEWEAGEDAPDLAAMYACHWNLDEETVRTGLEASYDGDLAPTDPSSRAGVRSLEDAVRDRVPGVRADRGDDQPGAGDRDVLHESRHLHLLGLGVGLLQKRCMRNPISSTRIASSRPARSIQTPTTTVRPPSSIATPLTWTASFAFGTLS